MNRSRVDVTGEGKFDAREWLRRDVLWASLMSPYEQQMRDFVTNSGDTALQQHNGNMSRRDTYAKDPIPESQSLSFFNQGKNVAGLISSAALFKSYMNAPKSGNLPNSETLTIQARCIDIALGSLHRRLAWDSTDEKAYKECSHLAQDGLNSTSDFIRKRRFLRASTIMCCLAYREANQWIADSYQNSEGTLPLLVINPGAHPRSAGPRVEKLKPVFNEIIGSHPYQDLRVAA